MFLTLHIKNFNTKSINEFYFSGIKNAEYVDMDTLLKSSGNKLICQT